MVLTEKSESSEVVVQNTEKLLKVKQEILSKEQLQSLLNKIEKFTVKLAHFIIKDNDIMNFPLRVIGSACVYFARTQQKIQPTWNKELEFISVGV